MNNPDMLRRLGLVAMIIAIVSGLVSLYLLFTSPTQDRTLAIVSVVTLVIGMIFDRRAGKLDDRNAG
jgi:membrane protein implicated in regulation of membrane protease activity